LKSEKKILVPKDLAVKRGNGAKNGKTERGVAPPHQEMDSEQSARPGKAHGAKKQTLTLWRLQPNMNDGRSQRVNLGGNDPKTSRTPETLGVPNKSLLDNTGGQGTKTRFLGPHR